MTPEDRRVYNALLNSDKDFFSKYFDKAALVDETMNSSIREYAIEQFQNYSGNENDFDSFMLKIYNNIKLNNICGEERALNGSVSTQTTSQFVFSNILPIVQNTLPKKFNAFDFLLEKKQCHEFNYLEFQFNDTIQCILNTLYHDETKINISAEEHIRKISDLIEIINKMSKYKIIELITN